MPTLEDIPAVGTARKYRSGSPRILSVSLIVCRLAGEWKHPAYNSISADQKMPQCCCQMNEDQNQNEPRQRDMG